MSDFASLSDDELVAHDLEALLEQEEEEEEVGEEEKEEQSPVPKRCRLNDKNEAELDAHSSQASPPGEHTITQQGDFEVLPDEICLQLLARLSAADLTSIAQTCKHFSNMSDGNELWRPLYSHRWREGVRENNGLLDQPSWKASYMERDGQRGEQIASRIPDKALQTSYLQSLVAERHMTVPRMPQSFVPANKALWGRITRWRGTRGLLACPSPALGSEHLGCRLKGPFTELLGGLYMCETCGWAHLCGEGCTEKLVDEVSESLVCPISGRCYDRLILGWEEDGNQEQEVEAGCDFGVAGHWGRAYSVGYNCSSEEELRRNCGVVI